VLLLDNYDSFTWNLVQALQVLGAEVQVVRNDAEPVAALLTRAPTHVVVSPGPGRPEAAGGSMALIEAVLGRVPLLGVCLGHQALGLVLGARLVQGPPVHGKSSLVHHDGRGLFEGLPQPLTVGRYHSLHLPEATLPPCLRVTARTEDGLVMAMEHVSLPAAGVQFHPESILTPAGPELLARFLAWPAPEGPGR
jgi:anthranilate synthase/aminodeoxychorismate synthase-like glutamine amidotransferase